MINPDLLSANMSCISVQKSFGVLFSYKTYGTGKKEDLFQDSNFIVEFFHQLFSGGRVDCGQMSL